MLSCFSFPTSLAARETFAHLELSESARRSNGLVRLWSHPSQRTDVMVFNGARLKLLLDGVTREQADGLVEKFKSR